MRTQLNQDVTAKIARGERLEDIWDDLFESYHAGEISYDSYCLGNWMLRDENERRRSNRFFWLFSVPAALTSVSLVGAAIARLLGWI